MKLAIAISTVLAILLTFALSWWLYPVHPTSIGVLFGLSFALSVAAVATAECLLKLVDKNEDQTPD